MENSRRQFLKVAGISALGVGAAPALNALASGSAGEGEKKAVEMGRGEKALTAKHWAMVIDTRKLKTAADLEPMIEACNKIHNIPTKLENKNHEIKWIWEAEYKHVFPTKVNTVITSYSIHYTKLYDPFLSEDLPK